MRPVVERLRELRDRHDRLQDAVVDAVCDRWAVDFTYLAFAFVFFYFGIQKPAPVDSPVRVPLSVFVTDLSNLLSLVVQTEVQIPLSLAIVFVGAYEMFLGLLFLFKQLRLAFWLFVTHQAVGFLALVVTYDVVFQPPWISIGGLEIPWALGGFSAFVLKNVVFLGAFMFLVSAELGTDQPSADSGDTTDETRRKQADSR